MKKLLISSLILFVIGCSVIFAAFAANDFNMEKMNLSMEFTKKEASYTSDEVSSVSVSIKDRGIQLSPSDDGNFYLEYYDAEKVYFVLSVDADKKLSITLADERKWYEKIFMFNYNPKSLILKVPAELLGEVQLTTTNSKITVENIGFKKPLKLKTTNDHVKLTNVNAPALEIATTNDYVHLENVSVTADITINTTNDNMTFKNVTADNISATSTNGKITMENVKTTQKGYFKTTNDPITSTDCEFLQKAEFKTTNGRITITDLKAPKISLITTNDRISGSIDGKREDYVIYSRTTNGNNNLAPSGSEDGATLYVKTSNDNILITFNV